MTQGKKKKAQSHNAFYFFMSERAQQLGGRYAFKDVAAVVSDEWSRMSPAARLPYEQRAMREKGAEKLTTLGETFSEVERRDRLRKHGDDERKAAINNMMVNIGKNTGLRDTQFFFLHFNYYCQREADFFPAEMALIRYTVLKGSDPDDILHTFIDLGPLPLGLAHKAMLVANESHMIPSPPLPEHLKPQRTPEMLLGLILNYLAQHGEADSNKLPPFFTMESLIPSAERILQQLAVDNGIDDPGYFRVLGIEELLYQMKNFTTKSENGGFPFKSAAAAIFNDDKFCYRKNIACEFHEEKDRVQDCSRSCVIRWGWHMSSHLCAGLEVPMVLGIHCPMDTARKDLQAPCVPVSRDSGDSTGGAWGGASASTPQESATGGEESATDGEEWHAVATSQRARAGTGKLRPKNTQSVAATGGANAWTKERAAPALAFFEDKEYPMLGAKPKVRPAQGDDAAPRPPKPSHGRGRGIIGHVKPDNHRSFASSFQRLNLHQFDDVED